MQAGQDLSLLAKPLLEQFRCKGQVDKFDGNLLLELPVCTVCKVDSARSAPPEQAINFVWTKALALQPILPAAPVLALVRGRAQFFSLTAIQKQSNFFNHCLVPAASGREQIITQFLGNFESLGKDCLDLEKMFCRLDHLEKAP
jgi:hypothetical protein